MAEEFPRGDDSSADVARASRGDAAASERVIAAWAPSIERFLRRNASRQVLARESAADLAQSVCREALEQIRRGALVYEGDEALRSWLYGAAELKVRNRLRRLGAAKRADDPAARGRGSEDPLDAIAFATDPTPSAAAVRGEDSERFRAALDRLDPRQRECVELFHLRDLSHAELAARLGVTEAHSRTLLARALARLAKELRRGAEDEG
jgi:RNA polymerase sigma-70 factor (ECF subfamily)